MRHSVKTTARSVFSLCQNTYFTVREIPDKREELLRTPAVDPGSRRDRSAANIGRRTQRAPRPTLFGENSHG